MLNLFVLTAGDKSRGCNTYIGDRDWMFELITLCIISDIEFTVEPF